MRCAIFRPRKAHLPWTKFFWYKPLLLLSSTYWPFSMCKILQKFLQRIQSYKDASFLGPKWFICPKQFFLEKKILSFASAYWLLSFCKIFKKFLEPIQSYEDVPFSGPKWPLCHEQNFFGTNHYYYFHLPIGLFHCAKFFKNSYSKSRLVRMRHFWAQNGSLATNKFFFWKKLYHFHSPIRPFHSAKF